MGLLPVLETLNEEELKQLVKTVMPASEWTGGRRLTWLEEFEETAKECKGYCVDDVLGIAEALEFLRAANEDGTVDE